MGKKLKWNLIVMSVLYLALGIFLLMVPGTALNVVCYALGGVVLLGAVIQLVRYFLVERGIFQSQLTLISGLVCLALGGFLILRSDIVVRILPIVFGLFVIFDSLGRVQSALELRRCGYGSWKGFLLLALLSVVLGVVMIVDPFGAMETLVRYFLVERGIFQSQLTLISGLVCLALGGFLILRSDIVVRILPIVFGLFVIFDSLGRVQSALELRRCGYGSWKGFLLLALLSVVLGVVMIVDPFGAMETLVMAIGVILIIEGALNLLSALYTMLAVRRFVKLHPEAQSVLEAVTGQDLNGDGVIAPDVARADAEATAVELDHVDESAEVEQENDNEQINE